MILMLFLQIEWNTINRQLDDNRQELVVYFTVPYNTLKFAAIDSFFYFEYENQLIAYDEKNNQVMGDYWEVRRLMDTLDIQDSVKMIIPDNSSYYNFRIIDRNAGLIFDLTENILQTNYLGNIMWLTNNDTLKMTYTVLNSHACIDRMSISLNDIQIEKSVKKSTYNDSIFLCINELSSGSYDVKIEVFTQSKKIDELYVPIRISKPFYLDESIWSLKVAQLEYIATPSQMKKLKGAQLDNRDSLWQAFWKQHDPTPNTKHNEKELEYFERIEYCEKHFSHGDKGWRSDRAKVYIKYGQPDEIQHRPYELYAVPSDPLDSKVDFYDSYETWLYYKMNRRFIFGDRYGLGQYILLTPEGSNL